MKYPSLTFNFGLNDGYLLHFNLIRRVTANLYIYYKSANRSDGWRNPDSNLRYLSKLKNRI